MNTFALVASALSAPNISLPIADHNAPLVGDELFGSQLNYQWRRVLVHLAENMLDRRIYDGTEIEIDTAVQQVQALISDMYTPETPDVDYLGALVGRTTNLAFGSTPVNIDFDDDTTRPMHNDSMMWNILIPAKIGIVPLTDGYYFCYGRVRLGGQNVSVVLRLTNGAAETYALAQMLGGGSQTLYVSNTVLMTGTGGLYLTIQTTSITRQIVASSLFPFSATLGMYKVGDEP